MALRFQGYGHLMLEFIERAKTGTGSAGRYDAKTMTQVGFACLVMPPDPLTDTAKAAWRAGLELMRSQRVPPDVNLCAKVAHPTSHLLSHTDSVRICEQCAGSGQCKCSNAHSVASHVQLAWHLHLLNAWHDGSDHSGHQPQKHPWHNSV